MLPRRSGAASATSSPTRRAFCSPCWCARRQRPGQSRRGAAARDLAENLPQAALRRRRPGLSRQETAQGDRRIRRWKIEIVTRTERTGSFKPEPKRWVVERTFAWLGRNRRLAKDFERTIASAEAWFLIAAVNMLPRRLARPSAAE